jgi:hypothetical protein
MKYKIHRLIGTFFLLYSCSTIYWLNNTDSILGESSLLVGCIALFFSNYIKVKEKKDIVERHEEAILVSKDKLRKEIVSIEKLEFIKIEPGANFFLLNVKKMNGKKDKFFLLANQQHITLLKEEIRGNVELYLYNDIVTGIQVYNR